MEWNETGLVLRDLCLVSALAFCAGCGGGSDTSPNSGGDGGGGAAGQTAGTGGSGASAGTPATGGVSGSGAIGGAGGTATLPDDRKGELWGSWVWVREGQNDCGGAYSSDSGISICHTDSQVNVTFGGNTYAATWDGTTLQFTGDSVRNGTAIQGIQVSFTIVGDEIVSGTGTYSDPASGCSGSETITGYRRTDFYWDGQLPARGGPCWLWEP